MKYNYLTSLLQAEISISLQCELYRWGIFYIEKECYGDIGTVLKNKTKNKK